jgi:hypothetical protein
MKELQNKPKPALSEMSGIMHIDDTSFFINSTFVKTVDQIVNLLVYFGMNGELQFESVKNSSMHTYLRTRMSLSNCCITGMDQFKQLTFPWKVGLPYMF